MTERPRYPRQNCCVPFCHRTSTLYPDEFMCGPHFRLVDSRLKRLRTRLRRRLIKRRASAAVRRRVMWGLWRRMKAQAIQRAAMG